MDGDLMITVIATGFGRPDAHPRAVERPAQAEEMRKPQWRPEREPHQPNRAERWQKNGKTPESLEVPAFLRRGQFD
jgi:hypothetical protein